MYSRSLWNCVRHAVYAPGSDKDLEEYEKFMKDASNILQERCFYLIYVGPNMVSSQTYIHDKVKLCVVRWTAKQCTLRHKKTTDTAILFKRR